MSIYSPTEIELRFALLGKALRFEKEISEALAIAEDNPHFQALHKEVTNFKTFLSASDISSGKIKEYILTVDSIVKTFNDMQQNTPPPVPPTNPNKPAQTPPPVNDDPLGLGLDLEGVLGDVLGDQGALSEIFREGGDDMLRVDGDKIILQIDEELEQSIDEEAKMFEVEQHYRSKDFFKALTVALALNIRFKQGIGRRSDAIVKRQDEIIFESNYRIVHENLERIKTAKGDEKIEVQLNVIMHIYAALDQPSQQGQEKYRNDMRTVLEKIVQKDSGFNAKGYIKTGFFSKVEVPGQEDKAAKSFFWKEKAAKEKDQVKKEFYLLMMFSSDLNYYAYQIVLANFYMETNRFDEACRYIKVALPLIESEGVDFLHTLRNKDKAYCEKFIERRFTNDIAQLRARFEKPDDREAKEKDDKKREGLVKERYKKFIQTVDLWQKRLDAMKTEIPFRSSTLRLEYTKGMMSVVNDALKKIPNLIVDEFVDRYRKTDVRSVQNQHIIPFIDFSFRYSVVPTEKTSQGLVVEGDAEAKLDTLCKSVVDYFNREIGQTNKPLDEVKSKLDGDTENLVKAMKAQGYQFDKIPVLTLR